MTKRVLVVDDSTFIARMLGRVLQSLGHELVATAHDGHEGLAAYEEHRPEIVLLDVTMPNMDGLDCLQAIRKVDPDARVIMISGIRSPETVQRCLDAGAVDFLQKPIRQNSPEDLEKLTRALELASQSEPGKALS